MSPRRSIGNGRGLRLLSIDGGGIRGLSPLLMLKEILYRIQQEDQLSEHPSPCDVFDLAGGTGTGGHIVLMLFRLRMSIDEAIQSYVDLARHVFSERKFLIQDGNFKAFRLEEAIVTIIQKALGISEADARSVRMLDEERPKCFVCATPAENVSFPSLFRTWTPAANQTYNCTIVEAARATSAAPTYFKSIEFGEPIKQRYLDGGLGCNNPVKHVVDEARSLYPNRPISCVISLGTGTADVIGLERPDAFQNLLPTNLIATLKRIATDCDMISEQIARDLFAQLILYVRLNVHVGLQNVSLAEWSRLNEVQTHTVQYLRTNDVGQKVDRLVQALKSSAITEEEERHRTKEESRRAKEERHRAGEEVDTDGWGEWQGTDIGPPKQNIPEGAGEPESDDRKEGEFEANEEADIAKLEEPKAEVEKLQDECEANTGDRNSKELENVEKVGQERQEIEKPKAEVEKLQDECEANMGDRNSKELENTEKVGQERQEIEKPKAEVEKLQDECEANTGDRNSKELENVEKVGQERQENEKPTWGTLLQDGPAIILPKQKKSCSFCGCVVM